jgi:hypothetical protein
MRHSQAALFSLFSFALGMGLRADPDQRPPQIVVTARAVFSRISPGDDGMEFRFNYEYPTAYLKEPPKTYLCSYEAMTYLITTPDGKQYSLNLIDKKKDTGHFTSAYFNLGTYKISDSVGAWPGLFNGKEVERRFYWKQPEAPIFTMSGEYHVVETGTFHDTAGKLPDLPFRSTEAICIVDPKVASLKVLKEKAQKTVRERISAQVPAVNWTIREIVSGDRIVSGLVERSIIPEDQVPEKKRKKGWDYLGMECSFTFSPDGELISEKIQPSYLRID